MTGSADSNCDNQSVMPYDNVIITAPHHGSDDPYNVKVYNALQCSGNETWVRSDSKSKARPCKEFKNKKKRYCLTCGIRSCGLQELIFKFMNGRWINMNGILCKC